MEPWLVAVLVVLVLVLIWYFFVRKSKDMLVSPFTRIKYNAHQTWVSNLQGYNNQAYYIKHSVSKPVFYYYNGLVNSLGWKQTFHKIRELLSEALAYNEQAYKQNLVTKAVYDHYKKLLEAGR